MPNIAPVQTERSETHEFGYAPWISSTRSTTHNPHGSRSLLSPKHRLPRRTSPIEAATSFSPITFLSAGVSREPPPASHTATRLCLLRAAASSDVRPWLCHTSWNNASMATADSTAIVSYLNGSSLPSYLSLFPFCHLSARWPYPTPTLSNSSLSLLFSVLLGSVPLSWSLRPFVCPSLPGVLIPAA